MDKRRLNYVSVWEFRLLIWNFQSENCILILYYFTKIPSFVSRMIADNAVEIAPAPLLPEYFVSVKMETNDDVPSHGKHYHSNKIFNLKYPVRSLNVEFSLLKPTCIIHVDLNCFRLLWITWTLQHNHRFCRIRPWIMKCLIGWATFIPIHYSYIFQVLKKGMFHLFAKFWLVKTEITKFFA